MNDYSLYDRNRIPILPGDTLKVFHYISAIRKEKRYMYKWVEEIIPRPTGPPVLSISHLDIERGHYWKLMNGDILSDTEIVQGYEGVESGQDYRDRERKV